MPELLIVRHGQASFGAENYDELSPLGVEQAQLAGDYLRHIGWQPDRVISGTLKRQIDTATAMGFAPEETIPGFNEYDFHNLLLARFNGNVPDLVMGDRKTHFRTLRETVFAWQADELQNPSETWTHFTTRIETAFTQATREGADRILVVSSGGVIGQTVAASVNGPAKMMMTLNLQVKNTALTKLICAGEKRFLHEFNATPHLDVPQNRDKLTYS